MHSTDYAVARCLSVCLSVSLSVRLSVRHTPVFCLNGYTYPQSFFHHRVAPPFKFFWHRTRWQYSNGDPTDWGVQYNGVWKNNDCPPISRFISEM